jgi:hypothetical protein
MKNNLRQIAVILSTLGMIVINILADALPINGTNTAAISDSFHVYFVPAGYVFSIWGIIYIGLIAYAIYQSLPGQKENPRLQATGWWIVLGNLFNSAWIFLWHYKSFPATLLMTALLLVTLILAYLQLGIGRSKVSSGEKWAVRLPISIYLGWATVATIANATAVLDYLNWSRFGLSQEAWMVIVLGAVVLIGGLMNFTRRDIAYSAVLLWALAGIAVKFPTSGIVTIATWIAFGLVAATLLAARLVRRSAVRT